MTTTTAPIRVVVWGENRHEQINPVVRGIYPDGMHSTIADGIRSLLRLLFEDLVDGESAWVRRRSRIPANQNFLKLLGRE